MAANNEGNPVAALNEFYQRVHVPLPRYEFRDTCRENANGDGSCRLFIAVAHLAPVPAPRAHPHGPEDRSGPSVEGFEAQMFMGEGPSKRAAKAAAAQEALAFVQGQPVFQASKPWGDTLWETVARALTNEVGIKLGSCRGYSCSGGAACAGGSPGRVGGSHRCVRGAMQAPG